MHLILINVVSGVKKTKIVMPVLELLYDLIHCSNHYSDKYGTLKLLNNHNFICFCFLRQGNLVTGSTIFCPNSFTLLYSVMNE